MKTWLITGCSSGIGRRLAQAVSASGDNVVATARDTAAIADLAESDTGRILTAPLDISDPDQIAAAVALATKRFGGVDVVVNNAGYGYRAAVEEAERTDAVALFETNFFGPVGLIREVLPGMRDRGAGMIVNLSSAGVHITPAGSGYYVAAKAALEALSGSLRREVEPFGIRVMIVEPGNFRTGFAGDSMQQANVAHPAYASTVGVRRKEHDRTHGTQRGDPQRAAAAIVEAVNAPRTPHLLCLGQDAIDAWREAVESQRKDVETWAVVSSSTDLAETMRPTRKGGHPWI